MSEIKRHSAGPNGIIEFDKGTWVLYRDHVADKEAALESVPTKVIEFLRGRKGFTWWWDDMDEDIQQELLKELADHLKEKTQAEPKCCDNPQRWASKQAVGEPIEGPNGMLTMKIITIGWTCESCDHREIYSEEKIKEVNDELG